MLKKRIAPALLLSLSLVSLPAASQASPLVDLPISRVDVAMKLAGWLDALQGHGFRTAGRPARTPRSIKNGCSIDPNGQPLCGPGAGGPGAGATTSSTGGDVSGE